MRFSHLWLFVMWLNMEKSSQQEAIKCRLELSPGTRYEPASRNVFSPGDTVRVTCGKKQFISEHQHQSAETTCRDDGKWTVEPVCKEVICIDPRDPLVSNWRVQWWRQIKLDETVDYDCRRGYKRTGDVRRATCTRDEWTPKPLCQEIICNSLDVIIPHANIGNDRQYKNNERAYFDCEEGYKGRPIRTCGPNGWTGSSQCEEIKCDRLDLPNANIVRPKWKYEYREEVSYDCKEGYKGRPTRTCGENGWTGDSQCEEIKCDRLDLPNANIVRPKWKYEYREEVSYDCKEGYKGRPTRTCGENGWTGDSQCEEIKCDRLDLPNANIVRPKWEYEYREEVSYDCKEGYKGRPTRTCGENGWTGDSQCEAIKCRLELSPGTRYEPASRNVFSPGDTVRVTCGEKQFISEHRLQSAETTCRDDGKWTVEPVCKEVICIDPRDPLVSSWRVQWWRQIKLDETVDYDCRRGYKRTGDVRRATCTRDEWTPKPLCQEIICNSLDVIIPHANIGNDRQYKNNDRAYFDCEEGYKGRPIRTCGPNGWTGSSQCEEIKCDRLDLPNANIVRPKWEYEYREEVSYVCKEGYKGRPTRTCGENGWTGDSQCEGFVGCETPPSLADGDTKYSIKSQYSHNEMVEYMCSTYYTMEGGPNRTCINGEWTGQLRCLKPCVVNEDELRRHNVTLKSTEKYFTHDEIIEFRCVSGTPVGAVAMRQRCNSGMSLLPTCNEEL